MPVSRPMPPVSISGQSSLMLARAATTPGDLDLPDGVLRQPGVCGADPGSHVLCPASGEDLRLCALELVVAEDAALAQVGECGEVSGRPARLTRSGEVLEGCVARLVSRLVLVHRVAAHEEVDEDAEQWQHEDEEQPERLGPVREVRAPEDVEDDADGDPDPEEEEGELERREKRVTEGECRKQHAVSFPPGLRPGFRLRGTTITRQT